MSRWLAGTFDHHGQLDPARLERALAPHAATVVECGPLRVAYTGPPASDSGEILCLFDGHLDNADELHRALEGTGSDPAPIPFERPSAFERAGAGGRTAGTNGHTAGADGRTAATEALLAAGYRRWGRALLGRLRGDFALLIWDRARNEGLLARDQLGVRSLFLHDLAGGLCFAGEVRYLLALLPTRPAPDPASVAHWIAVSNRPGLTTLYRGVRRLSPGGVLLLERGGIREERYWTPRFEEPLELGQAQLAEAVREALARSVRRRIAADGLTGVTLSGGLDSSSIAALGASEAENRLFTCSATFPEHPATDESELIAELRQTLALPGLSAAVRPGGLLGSALESLAAWELPLRSWGDFWMLPLMRAAAAAGVRTMLGGDGGDELFESRAYLLADRMRAGRPREALALTFELPGAADRPPRRALARVFSSLALLGALPYRLHDTLQRPFATRNAPDWLHAATVRELIRSDDPLAWKRLDGPRWWAYNAHGVTCRIEAGGAFEQHRRRAALAGIESRHPLLDLDLVTLALRQPPRATFDPHRTRPVLRASVAGLLPDAVRLRPAKAMFESLVIDCLRGPDFAAVRGLLTDPHAELGAYVDLGAVGRTFFDTDLELRRSPFRWMWQVWRLVTAECWLRAQTRPVGELLPPELHASPARVAICPS